LIQGTMLYKVTPALAPPARRHSATEAPRPRKRRASAVFDADGHEVLITLMCLKCHHMRPLAQFGLRKMPDGAIRNQPWCRGCRGAATPKRKPESAPAEGTEPRSGPVQPLTVASAPEPVDVQPTPLDPAR
jgi:hypothetical protein